MKPLFSIVIPTYNRGYILWKTMQSVQKQTYPHWELIIVDDGSFDDTEKVVAQFQSDPRIIYLKTPNGKTPRARNIGMQKARGEFIAYLDSDDIIYENFLSTVQEMFAKYPEKVFAIPNYNFRAELYNEKYQLIDFTEMVLRQTNNVTLQDIFYWKVKCAFGTGLVHRREVLKKGITWDESLKYFDDWDFVLQLGTAFPEGFLHIPYVLYEYRQRFGTDGTCSQMSYANFADGFDTIYQKHKDAPLMKGQPWHPAQIEKYNRKQKEFEEGKIPSSVYNYFPDFGKRKKSKIK